MTRDQAYRLEVLARRRAFLQKQQEERGAGVSVHVARESDALTWAITILRNAAAQGDLHRLDGPES